MADLAGRGGRAAVLVLQPGWNGELEACWVHRFSNATGGWAWELPCSRLQTDERPLDAALRALDDVAPRGERLLIHIAELASGAEPLSTSVLYFAALLAPGTPRLDRADLCWAPLRAWGSLKAGEPVAPASRDAAAALGLLWATGLLARLEAVWALLRENRLHSHPKLGRVLRERLFRRDYSFAVRIAMMPGQDAADVLAPLPRLREAEPLTPGRLGVAWLAGDPRIARIEAIA